LGAGRLNELQQAWDREYEEVRAYTTSYRGDLDRGVHFLLQYLAGRGERIDGPIVDCGCGMGRNAIPLARSGHQVLGLEHSAVALGRLEESRGDQQLAGSLTTRQHDLNEPLPVDDDFAAIVLDITAVDNLIDESRRRAYGREVARILRPGGIAMVVTFARDDGYYGRFLEESPWGAQGIVEDPNTEIRNQLFTADLLDEVFVPPLTREVAATLVFLDDAAGVTWTRRFLIHIYRG
jgi:SAM-dependent methyltransferase